MNALYSLNMVVLQGGSSLSTRDQYLLMIFIGVVAVAIASQAAISVIAGITAIKTLKEVKTLAQDLHSKATPIIQKTTEIVSDLSPKIRTVSENVTQMSYTVREKVDEVGETVTQINRTVIEANQKTRGQVDHVDRLVKTALDTTEEVAHTVADGIRGPLKQVAGMIAGLRVGIETLVRNFTPRG
jgi:small-conductance mechanosensitive channel